MTKKIISKSSKQTQIMAKTLAENLKGGEILALNGDLGCGKTTFTQGLASGFGIKNKIKSPSFVLIKKYPIKYKLNLVHIDLYRLKTYEIKSLGIEEYLGKKENICVIEWAAKIKKFLPKGTIWIKFEFINTNQRQIQII